VWGAGMGPGSSSAGSTGGGGVVSSTMVGLGSMSMAASTLPFVGATLGPIGLGIAAIGMIGGAAGWF